MKTSPRDSGAVLDASLAARYGAPTAILAATLLYATLRYCVFGTVPWAQLPLFVAGKAAAWASVLLLLAAAWRTLRPLAGRSAARHASQGAALAGVHVLVALALHGPATFPTLYGGDGRPTLRGSVALLAGVLATTALLAPRTGPRGLLLPWLLAAHCAAIGAPGWLEPGSWPGQLVPISLLSFLSAGALLVVRLLAWRRAVAAPPGSGRHG